MTLNDIRKVAATVAVVGLVTGYMVDRYASKRAEPSGLNESLETANNLRFADELQRLRSEHGGCLGLARTPTEAKESYLAMCSKKSPVKSNDQLAVDHIDNLVVAYRIN